MAQEIFKRYEKKYMLSREQYRNLMIVLGGILTMEEYGQHTIRNIYFDTSNYELIRASIEKPVYKEKLRLRCYGDSVQDNTPVYVELKKKYEDVVYKRRIEMQLEDARRYLYYGMEPDQQGQIFREVDYAVKHYGLKPMAYISYEREAYTCPMYEGLRFTFDRNIMGRSGELDLRVKPYGKKLLDEGQILMELKIPGAVPAWLGRLMAELEIYPTSYSKYGVYYKKYIQPELVRRIESRVCTLPAKLLEKGGYICA